MQEKNTGRGKWNRMIDNQFYINQKEDESASCVEK